METIRFAPGRSWRTHGPLSVYEVVSVTGCPLFMCDHPSASGGLVARPHCPPQAAGSANSSDIGAVGEVDNPVVDFLQAHPSTTVLFFGVVLLFFSSSYRAPGVII